MKSRTGMPKVRLRLPPPAIAGAVSSVMLFVLYFATAAPDLTFWDASEFISAAHTLGIPHPPGTPLWVLLGKLSASVFSNLGPVRAVTMLSVVASALVGGLGAMMATRWIGMHGAVAAAVSAGAMMSVWSNATETEVYAAALLLSACMLYSGERAGRAGVRDEQRTRWRTLLVFLAALSVPLHLSALVALPAAIAFAWRGTRPSFADVAMWCAIAALALSAVAVLAFRAASDPALDSGHPVTLRALIAVLRREQFDVPGLWPRTAPLWLQIGNFFEWADWQVAFGAHPLAPPSWTRTPVTLLWTWCAAVGLRTVWRHEPRVGRALAVLLASATLGVVVWLNMRAGPSFGVGILAPGAVHEARERDYFFVLGFWCWGLLAGAGIATMAQRLGARVSARSPRAAVIVASAVLAAAAVPVIANEPAVNRRHEPLSSLPRVYARLLLEAVPINGVLFAAGDNDTFPIWYLQQVEAFRTDVTVVTVPLLGATWYREQLHRRRALLPASYVTGWPGLEPVLKSIAAAAGANGRRYRVSTLLAARDRRRIDPAMGWALEGMVYAPSSDLTAGEVGIDRAALAEWRERVPPSALAPLPRGVDGAGEQVQALLRCTRVTTPHDRLLVSGCNGT